MNPTKNLVIVDVEATGPNPLIHELLSVALVPVFTNSQPLLVHVRVDKPEWSDFGRENFLSFRDDWERTAVEPREALTRIDDFVGQFLGAGPLILVGHNVGFDLSFLKRLATACGRMDLGQISHRSIDTHTLLYLAWLRGLVPREALTSDGAFRVFGVAPAPVGRHTALGDALATRELFVMLLEMLGVDERNLPIPR